MTVRLQKLQVEGAAAWRAFGSCDAGAIDRGAEIVGLTEKENALNRLWIRFCAFCLSFCP